MYAVVLWSIGDRTQNMALGIEFNSHSIILFFKRQMYRSYISRGMLQNVWATFAQISKTAGWQIVISNVCEWEFGSMKSSWTCMELPYIALDGPGARFESLPNQANSEGWIQFKLAVSADFPFPQHPLSPRESPILWESFGLQWEEAGNFPFCSWEI